MSPEVSDQLGSPVCTLTFMEPLFCGRTPSPAIPPDPSPFPGLFCHPPFKKKSTQLKKIPSKNYGGLEGFPSPSLWLLLFSRNTCPSSQSSFYSSFSSSSSYSSSNSFSSSFFFYLFWLRSSLACVSS